MTSRLPALAALALAAIVAAAPLAAATEFQMTLFGHAVAIVKAGDEESLEIDGRSVLKDYYLFVDEVRLVGGVPVVLGSASAGGNACDGAPFVLSFPDGAAPRIDGPIDSCVSVSMEEDGDSLVFSTRSTPNEPGERWSWTAEGGLKSLDAVAFQPDAAKGWAELRDRTATHPGDLFDYADIGGEIARLAGDDQRLVNDILMGVGSGAFKGDYFVGTACSRHMCMDQEALVIADIPSRTVYLAWKPSGQKIRVNPPVKTWPEKAKAEIRAWAAKWN
ncbi:hypothetical protein J5J10_09290 [Ciceribacter sp. L1K23]|uniref:hypothetical protein n=1 Tax=unclassified Ciceribacter TaxID=2628820 RepID=UPI001ABDF29F|nr:MULTISPECIES: hypothetical protein [unclassified Ciceribacter]MBO3759979.1 hypothetical protein [Ciceribacter sp. L1K22]MBR0555872.1 hypothetical protein [Ciceribacter sp. L1K23]